LIRTLVHFFALKKLQEKALKIYFFSKNSILTLQRKFNLNKSLLA
jgi:hypothetical protein